MSTPAPAGGAEGGEEQGASSAQSSPSRGKMTSFHESVSRWSSPGGKRPSSASLARRSTGATTPASGERASFGTPRPPRPTLTPNSRPPSLRDIASGRENSSRVPGGTSTKTGTEAKKKLDMFKVVTPNPRPRSLSPAFCCSGSPLMTTIRAARVWSLTASSDTHTHTHTHTTGRACADVREHVGRDHLPNNQSTACCVLRGMRGVGGLLRARRNRASRAARRRRGSNRRAQFSAERAAASRRILLRSSRGSRVGPGGIFHRGLIMPCAE